MHFLQTVAKKGSSQMSLTINWTVCAQQPYEKICGYFFSTSSHIAFILFSVSVMRPEILDQGIPEAATTRSKSAKHHSELFFSTSEASVELM